MQWMLLTVLNRLKFMKEAALQTAAVENVVITEIIRLENRLNESNAVLNGDGLLTKREFETTASVSSRIGVIMQNLISTTSAINGAHLNSYALAGQQFAPVLAEVKAVGEEVKRIENLLEQKGAPYTPGRVPEWRQQ